MPFFSSPLIRDDGRDAAGNCTVIFYGTPENLDGRPAARLTRLMRRPMKDWRRSSDGRLWT